MADRMRYNVRLQDNSCAQCHVHISKHVLPLSLFLLPLGRVSLSRIVIYSFYARILIVCCLLKMHSEPAMPSF